LILALNFGLDAQQILVRFGILVLISIEVGIISPPFELKLFVINSQAKDVPMIETYKGAADFAVSDIVRIILLTLALILFLWLPGLW
jgi:TRAP-type C4-dicarboxylate transport system permease large subunit